MNKKLNISAIIPKELYVQRDADRKLKEVIQLMSKPAYISVSRQMGKTNLLINAKRELQNENNRYVFIDITGSFTSSQDCFRYIVNQILDSNEDIEAFETASQVINSKRKESINRSSTEEFQSEIRTILKYFKGNLIIFLDEVDDLVKHSFSDEIFGQIRKTYFIRETYDVLKRVTYVLSGVIDPEKLIKSKENSPFNIAIPIYLQDFTYDEFKEFVFKSNLPLTEDIEEYIYDWLSGNPRMTFDVLSQIEDEYITNNVVNKQLVDNVIQTIYLDSYKQPPVDHIRDLVKHDTEVRTALISLKKGNIDELSDSSVNKLYLFGIVKSKIKSSISIKNKVIEACLSDDWLEKVELEKKGYLDYGEDKMSQGLYKEAIFYFNEYINNNQSNKSLVNLAKYNIGKAYYNSRDFKKALEYLSPKPIKKETSAEIYFLQILYLGISHFKIGQLEDALKMYDEVLNDCSSPNTVVTAMMNKGELMFTQQMKDYENAILIHTSTIEYIEKNKDDIVEYNYSKTIANYRMGYAYYELKNKNDALPYFEKALETADKKYRPEILLFIDSCLDTTRSERHSFFTKIANEIIDNKITFDINDNSIIQFPEYHLHFCLLNLYEYKQIDEYEKLLDYSIKNIYLYKISFAELIYKVASFSFGLQQYKDGTELLLHVINRDDSTLRIKKDCYLLLSMGTSKAEDIFKKPYISYLLEYIDIFSSNNNFGESVELGDVNAFLNAVTYYRENNDLKKSFEIALTISNYYNDQLANDTKASYAFVYFFIIDYLSSIGNLNGVQQYGEKALEVISKINPFLNDLSYIDKKHLNNIEQRVKAMMDTGKRVKVVEPVKLDRKIGRNEYVTVRYKDGGRITTKFKKVEHDIRNGECIIDEG